MLQAPIPLQPTAEDTLHTMLKRSWEIEEISKLSRDARECEAHYAASRQLQGFGERVTQQHGRIESELRYENISWHLIPPRAAHFGGLWDSAVKSTKFHLKQIMVNTAFTSKEMNIAPCQIEKCLNSRPLCKITDDPEDQEFLTPNRFLMGHTTEMRPDNSPFTKSDLIHRWNLIQEKVHHFWKAWSSEYSSTMNFQNK